MQKMQANLCKYETKRPENWANTQQKKLAQSQHKKTTRNVIKSNNIYTKMMSLKSVWCF